VVWTLGISWFKWSLNGRSEAREKVNKIMYVWGDHWYTIVSKRGKCKKAFRHRQSNSLIPHCPYTGIKALKGDEDFPRPQASERESCQEAIKQGWPHIKHEQKESLPLSNKWPQSQTQGLLCYVTQINKWSLKWTQIVQKVVWKKIKILIISFLEIFVHHMGNFVKFLY
jgi:hypothetical protein